MEDYTAYERTLRSIRETLLKRKDPSRKSLARRSGISVSTWRRIRDEGNKPSLKAVFELASAEHIPITALLTEKTETVTRIQKLVAALEAVPESSREQALRSMEAVAASFK